MPGQYRRVARGAYPSPVTLQFSLGGLLQDTYQLLDFPFAFGLIARGDRIGHTVLNVILEDKPFHACQGSTHCLGLGNDIDAIAVVGNHACKTTDLSFDTGKACAGVLPSFWCHALIIPQWGIT